MEAARPRRHSVGDRWCVDESYVKVAGVWRYLYRALDQFGQMVDVLVSPRRDTFAARQFFATAIMRTGREPAEVVTDRARIYPAVVDEVLPGAFYNVGLYANNAVEVDHGRLKARLRPMRGVKRDRSARVIMAVHALVQNVRRGDFELGVEATPNRRLVAAFAELARSYGGSDTRFGL
jgi:IS6 family transposase